MQYIKMGSDLKFSRIVQGFWRLTGGLPGSWDITTNELVDSLDKRFELGVTTLDTAEVYGRGECEVQLGNALKGFKRDAYQIVTKTGISFNPEKRSAYYDTTFKNITNKCKNSIKKLGCEYIDLFLIHREDPMIDHHEVARAFAELKKEGLIKEAGVSNFDPFKFNSLNKVMGGTLRTNQIELHPCCFEHFNSGMIDVLQSKKVHPMIWSPLAGGRIATDNSEVFEKTRNVGNEIAQKYNVSLNTIIYAWLLKHPVGALPLVGSNKIDRLHEAISALDINIELEDWYSIYTASGQQKIR